MKKFVITVIAGIILGLSLQSCSSDCSKQKETQDSTMNTDKTPNVVVNNRSLAEIEVIEIIPAQEDQFIVKAKVLSIEEDPAYQSIAEPGQEYELQPNFVLDENYMRVDNERNKELYNVRTLKEGDQFKAEIFYNENGWFIKRVIK